MTRYADTYSYKRNNPSSLPTQTNGFASGNRLLCKRLVPDERPRRNPQGQTAVRTGKPVADGFLKSRFLPKLAVSPDSEELSDERREQRERDFYRSLSLLARYYGFTPMQSENYPYPYNFTLALWDAEKQIRQLRKGGNFDDLQLSENKETKQIFLSVTERYDTGQYLYYIPVIPLFTMLKDRKRKRSAELLLSVFTYLNRIVGVPCFREEQTFLYWQYEMLKEWAMHDDDSDENRALLNELHHAEWLGERINRKMSAKENLTFWKRRIQSFRAKDSFDTDVFLLTVKFFQLYRKYPNHTVFKNITALWDEYGYYYDEEDTKITIDKYIGFIADDNGLLYEQLCETINSEFSQYAEMEEPAVTHHFDGTSAVKNILVFESRLFPLINELCTLLNQYTPTET